jgi:hypothetical protein
MNRTRILQLVVAVGVGFGAACAIGPDDPTSDVDVTTEALTCSSGFHVCGSSCVSNNSPAHCGVSCTACPAPVNGTAACTNGRCGGVCATGFKLCSGVCIRASSACTFPCPTGMHNCGGICQSNTSVNAFS